ncbi:MAG: hypothetical protein A3D95_02390 [Betaproteobacteria bacterium RIFCSPHIGHO2_12_FULL_69_13]|nr:MAG: hypothetical protein A3D95_02390 [Betaproteobacteria bacterium RIFCSPHIGHO2_12_FULL_69_13]
MFAALSLPQPFQVRPSGRPATTLRSADELRRAMRDARGTTVAVDASALDRVLRFDAARGLVEVQAATRWDALSDYLRASSVDLSGFTAGAGLPSTVGATVEINAPGPDGRPLVAHVDALALVTPDGELRRVSRQSNPELFALAAGGQGAFGTLYSATLRIEGLAAAASARDPAALLELPAACGRIRTLALLVPPQSLECFLADARARCLEWRIPIEGVEVRRTLPEDETRLRWARREYAAVALALGEPPTLGGCVRSTQLRRELIDAAIERGGSFPVACTPEATRAQTEACYPELRAFLAEKRRCDPAERLSNPWYRHHRSLLGREACPVRWGV